MILDRQKFEINDKVLIEKVIIQAPFRYEVIFEDEGCFLYVSGAKSIFHSPNQKVITNSNESVLLKCGSYFVDWLKKSDDTFCTVYAIHLYPDVLKSIYRNELPSFIVQKERGTFIQKIIPDVTLTKFIESLDFYFESPALVNQELLELKIRELMLILIQTKNADSIFQILSELFTPRKVSVKEVVDNHLYSNVDISKLAQLCNMSLSTFNRSFKKIFNDNPVNYINNKRLDRAKELLEISDMSVSDIAYELGFSDPAYFSRLFKKKFSITPASLR